MIVQRRAQHRVKPGIHPLGIAQLILARQHTNAEFLQHVFGIGPVAEPFDEEPEKRGSPGKQRAVEPAACFACRRCGIIHVSRGLCIRVHAWAGHANSIGHSRAHLLRTMM